MADHDPTRLRSQERAEPANACSRRVGACCDPDEPISTTVTCAATSLCAAVAPGCGRGRPETAARRNDPSVDEPNGSRCTYPPHPTIVPRPSPLVSNQVAASRHPSAGTRSPPGTCTRSRPLGDVVATGSACERNATRPRQVLDRVHEIRERAGEPVELPHHHGVRPARGARQALAARLGLALHTARAQVRDRGACHSTSARM